MSDKFTQLIEDGTDFDLYMAIAQASLDKFTERGIDSLTKVQRIAMHVWVASGVIGNRGFFNHEIEDMVAWAQSYEDLGIQEAAGAIRKAAEIMPAIDWNGEDPSEQKLDPLEKQFYATDKETEKKIAVLIRNNPDDAIAGLVLHLR
jgi:hypothetical protein